eukprot:CAMPEP_0195527192 /NCGR_PEP_ID=MMETSP0794_2-20130614/28704_1 /TAXON_ID=515487 /ORGANISM="Stephanopyxis turris, Strain CCMP 815" /LENGTH=334 /DNA_ID=CAMNT_0040658053 /DNA_START=85 /DNA_END=1086 /DNA_ORIENTATION=+
MDPILYSKMDSGKIHSLTKTISHQGFIHIASAETVSYELNPRKALQQVFKHSSVPNLASNDCLEHFPKFRQNEIVLNKTLGKGRFGIVKQVRKVNILSQDIPSHSPIHSTDLAAEITRRRAEQKTLRQKHIIAAQYIRKDGNARYAVKSIQKHSDPTEMFNAIIDLAVETRILSVIEHPNIIKMRGLSAADICSNNHFLVLDRLYDTLEKKIKKWRKKDKKSRSFFGKLHQHDKKNHLLDDRLKVLFDLASALTYLHFRRIMHRDLKPENIGFDIRGDVKIFDFGLARDLPPKDNETYKLTGKTGSLLYMAPEVFYKKPYNETADIYSFGIIIW